MPIYRLHIWETQVREVDINAESEDHARRRIGNIVEEGVINKEQDEVEVMGIVDEHGEIIDVDKELGVRQ